MLASLRPALSLLLAFSLLVGLLYPLTLSVIAQWLFPYQAQGSLIERDGRIVGSALIGQQFTDPGHFWGRPSATTPQPYNALASGGSNLGPSNPALLDAVRSRLALLRAADPGNPLPVPEDLLLASASGLDPQISPAAARYQAARIARVRQIPAERVLALIAAQTQERQWGVLGEPCVNVLRLNLALDAAH